MGMVFSIRIIADRGLPTLYAVTSGLNVISTHKTQKRAQEKLRILERKSRR